MCDQAAFFGAGHVDDASVPNPDVREAIRCHQTVDEG